MRDAGQGAQFGVGTQVAPFAVDRHEVLRAADVVEVQELARGRVAGDVDLGVALVDDVRAPAGQAVDDAVDRVLVAGDEGRREDHRVAVDDSDLVVAVGHPRQGCHRFALGAGADQHHLVVREVVQRLDVHDQARRDLQVAQVPGDAHVADHRAADEGDPAAVFMGGVEDLLDAVDVAGEARHDDALAGAREHLAQDVGDVALVRGEARYLRVRGVGEEEVDAFLAQPGERVEVREAVVQRELVHLEVACVDHQAGGRADRDGQGVRDGVVDGDELAVEGADALAVPLRHLKGVGADAVLLELGLDEGEGQLGADQRDVRLLAQEEGDAADVVLVAVGEDDALDVVEAVPDGREVRQDQVDSGLLLLREEHSAVDDQQAAAVLEDRHVSADFAEAAQRGDPQAAFGERRGRAEFRMRMTQKTLLTTRATYRSGTWRA